MKKKTTNLLLRVGLFLLILCIGTGVALIIGETTGLALADLSSAPVETITKTPQSDILYAALGRELNGVYRSDDYGRSWQMISPEPGADIVALAIHQNAIYASAEDELNSLWYSDDAGQIWHQRELSLPVNTAGQRPTITALAIAPADPNLLYVGTEGQGLYRLRGEHGQAERVGDEAMQNLYVKDIVISPNNQLYTVATEGVFVVNGRATHKLEGLPDAAVSLAIDPTDSQKLYAGTVGYGLHASEDAGRTWRPLNTGLGWQPGIILQVSAITIDEDDPQHLALATAYGVGSRWAADGIYESFNGGQHWVKIANSDEVVDKLLIEKGGVYVATTNGLTRYGDPLPQASLTSLFRFQSLTNPTGVQALILVLTVMLAGWALLGHLTWTPQQERNGI
jgi:hypothetical protein